MGEDEALSDASRSTLRTLCRWFFKLEFGSNAEASAKATVRKQKKEPFLQYCHLFLRSLKVDCVINQNRRYDLIIEHIHMWCATFYEGDIFFRDSKIIHRKLDFLFYEALFKRITYLDLEHFSHLIVSSFIDFRWLALIYLLKLFKLIQVL